MGAIETTGRVEKSGLLKLDRNIGWQKKQKVKVIILYDEDDDFSEKAWLKALSGNPAFEFLNSKKEDVYSINNGKPIKK